MSDSWSDETISAWLDDQLGPAEREQFEMHLKENPRDAERVQEFQSLREQLREAPRFQLDDGFAGRVAEAIRQRGALPDLPEASLPMPAVAAVESPVTPSRRRAKSTLPAALNWQAAGAMISGLAALLLLAMFLAPQPTQTATDARLSQQESNAQQAERSVQPEDAAGPAGAVEAEVAESGTAAGGQADGSREKQMRAGEVQGQEQEYRRSAGDADMTADKSAPGNSDDYALPAPAAAAESAMESFTDSDPDSDASRGGELPAAPLQDQTRAMLDEESTAETGELQDLKSERDAVEEMEGADSAESDMPVLPQTVRNAQRGMAGSANQPDAGWANTMSDFAFDEIVIVSTRSNQLPWLVPQSKRVLDENNDFPTPPNPPGISMKRDNSFGSADQPSDDRPQLQRQRRDNNRRDRDAQPAVEAPLENLMFVTVEATESELQSLIDQIEGQPLTLQQGQLVEMMSELQQSGGGGGFGGSGARQREMSRGREPGAGLRMQMMQPSTRSAGKFADLEAMESEQQSEKGGEQEDEDEQAEVAPSEGAEPMQTQPNANASGRSRSNAGMNSAAPDQPLEIQLGQSGQTTRPADARRRYLLVIQRLPAEAGPAREAPENR